MSSYATFLELETVLCFCPSGRPENSGILPKMGSGGHVCWKGQVAEEAGGTAEHQKMYLCLAFGV